MPRKLELKTLLRLSHSIQRCQRYLEFTAAGGASGDDRDGAKPFRDSQFSLLHVHVPLPNGLFETDIISDSS
jgi:hypothetical protein